MLALLLRVIVLLGWVSGGCRAHAFSLPNVNATFEMNGLQASLQATDIICSGLSVRALTVSWSHGRGEQSHELHFEAGVSDFLLECYLNYAYSTVSATGNNGSAFVVTEPNSLDLVLDVVVPTSARTDPTVLIQRCDINILVSEVRLLNEEPLDSEFMFVITNDLGVSLCKLLEDPTQLSRFLHKDNHESGTTVLTDFVNDLLAKEGAYLQEIEQQASSPYKLVDFSRSGTWPAWGVTGLLGWLGQYYLGRTVTREASEPDLAINFLMRDLWSASAKDSPNSTMLVVNLTKPIVFEAPSLAFNSSSNSIDDKATNQHAMVLLDQVQVTGHDSVTRFSNFSFVGQQSFQVDVALDEVGLRMLGSLLLHNNSDPTTIQEDRIVVDFSLQNVDATLVFFLAVDEDALGAIPLGGFLSNNEEYDNNMGAVIHCLASSVVRVSLADSSVRSLGIRENPNADDLLRIRAAGVELDSLSVLFDVLPMLFSGKDERASGCTPPDSKQINEDTEANPYIDFRDLWLDPIQARANGGTGTQPYGSVLSSAKTFLMEELLVMDPTNGQLRINMDFMAPFTRAQSGHTGLLDFDNETVLPLISNVFVGSMAESHFHVELQRIGMRGLNKFKMPTSVFDPSNSSGFVVSNMVSLQQLELTTVVSASLYVDFLGNITVQDIAWTVELKDFALALEMLAVLSKRKFLELPLVDLLDVNCWLAAIPPPSADTSEENLSLKNIMLTAGSVLISSQYYEDGSSPSSKHATEEYRTLNDFFERLLTPLRGYDTLLQEQIHRMILEAPTKCHYHPSNASKNEVASFNEGLDLSQSHAEKVEPSTLFTVTIDVLIGLFVFSVSLFLGAYLVMARRHRAWLQSLKPDLVAAIYKAQENTNRRQRLINAAAGSMVKGEGVPGCVRWLVPLLIIVSTGLLLAGFWMHGIGGSLFVQLAGQNVLDLQRQDSLYTFVRLLWTNDSETLGVVIWVVAIGIPMVKNLGIVSLWIVPTSYFSVSKRLVLLDILHEMGRADIMVTFVFLLLTACVRISIASNSILSLSGTSLYEVNVLLYPVLGLYVWTIGAYASQVACRVFRHYHLVSLKASTSKVYDLEKEVATSDTNDGSEKPRRVNNMSSTVTTEEFLDDANVATLDKEVRSLELSQGDESVFLLCQTVFVQPYSSAPVRVRPATNIIIGTVAVVAVGLVTAGCIFPVITINATGVIADLIHIEEGIRVNSFDVSLISLVKGLVRDAATLGDVGTAVGLWLLAILTLLTVWVTPILSVLLLLTLWFYPLQARRRDSVSFVTDQFRSFQYSEFFMIAALCIAGSLPQILDISRSILGPYCEAFGGILLVGVKAGFLEEREIVCYIMKPSLRIGALLLLAGGVSVTMLYAFISAASNQMKLPDSTATAPVVSAEFADPAAYADSDKQTTIKLIRMPAAVFSQTYRWFLCPADERLSPE